MAQQRTPAKIAVATPLCSWKTEQLPGVALPAVSNYYYSDASLVVSCRVERFVILSRNCVIPNHRNRYIRFAPFLLFIGSGCKNNISGCCDGLVCTEFSQWYSQCLPGEDDSTPIDVDTPRPTTAPVPAPTQPPVATPRPSLRPTNNPTSRPTAPPVAAGPTQPPVDSENCLARCKYY